MREKTTRVISSSQVTPDPLFAVYDSLTDTWYEMDAEAWADLVLQADDEVSS